MLPTIEVKPTNIMSSNTDDPIPQCNGVAIILQGDIVLQLPYDMAVELGEGIVTCAKYEINKTNEDKLP